jgi:hypothetical protein
MEQTTQQVTQKPPLPIKTKIAVWWMIVVGVIGIISSLAIYEMATRRGGCIMGEAILSTVLLISGFIFLFCAFLLKLRKKWAWYVSVIIFFIPCLYYLLGCLSELLSIRRAILEGMYQVSSVSFSHDIREFIFFGLIPFIILLVPTILLLLDRKNFWKIVS